VPQVVRVRIPALAVDAPVLQMGIDAAGAMEVPQSPTTVAWYGFAATPGSAGNAVMAAHVTWGGARAVFNQLHALRAGDIIEVRTAAGDLRYAVQRTYLVRPEEADVAAIVGPREGPQTLTLITCGGSFDSSIREYDHRVIVFATRV
jgi:LPXTG-site transpeptidase (sortase) family protein